MGFAVEHAEVEREHGDDEGVERHPPHQGYFLHEFCFLSAAEPRGLVAGNY
jgi:hypothetical protein